MAQEAQWVLSPDSVEANRSGRLTDTQLQNLRSWDRGAGTGNLKVAALCVILAIVLFVSRSPGRNAWLRPYAAAGALAVAGYLVLRSRGRGSRLSKDLRSGRVAAVEGAISKSHSYMGGNANVYFLEVAGKQFSVSSGSYQAAPDAAIVRVYYLPKSHHVVNLERLADRPLPEGALASPIDMVKTLAPALLSRDRTERAEAGATLAALGSTLTAAWTRTVTPPPMGQRDPRPLAEAIVGRWCSGPVSIEFSRDGSLAATLPGGAARHGHWRVDASGRLHADALGEEQVGDAWVVGNELTLSADGEALTLTRA
jgi:hypothetical protein